MSFRRHSRTKSSPPMISAIISPTESQPPQLPPLNPIFHRPLFQPSELALLSTMSSTSHGYSSRLRYPPRPRTYAQIRAMQVAVRAARDDPSDCPICLTPLNSAPVVALRCMHGFHRDCIGTWALDMASRRCITCPICRHICSATYSLAENEQIVVTYLYEDTHDADAYQPTSAGNRANFEIALGQSATTIGPHSGYDTLIAHYSMLANRD